MAITENEFNISNKSYTNKDFGSVYEELLDLCKKLSNRWDPETSNESDPGIVLLKLAAFIADKNNYNIDKNVLETFMPSATQEESMRELCSRNGYEVKYYNSAITNVSFMYTNTLAGPFTLPRYSTVVTTDSADVNYTLIENCTIASTNVKYTAKAIQGTLETLLVGDSSTIQLANIDDNNRIYIPDTYAAENGIIVTDTNGDNAWTKVDNLNVEELNNRYYKFGFDSHENLPYIEFPSDIANLIGEGLLIRYITSMGAEGNVSAKALSTLISPSSVTLDTDSSTEITDLADYLSISNASAATDGRNPETIDEAYSNFKKTVGTFNTLVTCRDYANFIYNLVDEATLKYIVSNIQVCDRRDDFNYSNNITTYNSSNGIYTVANPQNITANQICMYPLKPITTGYTLSSYEQSFQPLGKQILENNADLADVACMSYDVKEFDANDVYCFKNKYNLDIKVGTYEKIDSIQQEIVIENIQNALYENFHAKNVDFGEALVLQTIKDVVLNADSRITDVNIAEPTITTYVMKKDGSETALLSDTTSVKNIVVKNILAGKISMFDYADLSDVFYGQSLVNGLTTQDDSISKAVYQTIRKIKPTSSVANSILSSNDGYTVRQNESIQLIAPNFVTEVNYGSYVCYRYTSENLNTINKDSIYQLKAGDELRISYTDSDTGIQQTIIYTSTGSTINGKTTKETVFIKPNFDLVPLVEDSLSSSYRTVTFNGEDLKFLILGTSDTIEKVKQVKTTLNSAYLPCYWIMNNKDNCLFKQTTAEEETVLLNNGEYFMYSNSDLTELLILGAGTQIILTNASVATANGDWSISSDNILELDEINSKGLLAFTEDNWQYKQLSTYPIELEEMQIISLSEDDWIKGAVLNDSLTEEWQDIGYEVVDGSLSGSPIVNTSDSNTQLTKFYATNIGWQGRIVLDINAGPSLEQRLLSNQKMELVCGPSSSETRYTIVGSDSTNTNISFNYKTVFTGTGEDIQVDTRTISGITVTLEDGITGLVYNKSDVTLEGKTLALNSNNMYSISAADLLKSTSGLELKVLPFNEDTDVLVFIYNDVTGATIKVTANGNIKLYNSDSVGSTSLTLNYGINTICITGGGNVSTLTVTCTKSGTTAGGSIMIALPKVKVGLNESLGEAVSEDDLITAINELDKYDDESHYFYYTADINNDKDIDLNTDETLLSPEAFWDKNNLANKLTIPQIDFDTTTISVLKSSRK